MTRRGSRRRSAAGPSIPQLPWRRVENTHGTLDVLRLEQLDEIHEASMHVLEELGIELMSPEARRLLADAGAMVDDATGNVRIGRELVDEALSTAPSSFTLRARNNDKSLIIGDRHLAFGLVAGPPAVHDEVRGRRPSNMADYRDFIRLAHHFNAIHLIGNQVASPIELPANTRHLDCYDANLTHSDLTYHCLAIGRGRTMDGIEMMAISRGQRPEEMIGDPGVLAVINVNSPRRIDGPMAEGLMTLAEFGQVATITPFTLMGAMTPATLGAALVQQNAEALFGVTLTQLVRPGAPVMYGSFTSNVDMRSGSPAFGTPENAKANVAAGQLARRYGLPYRTTAANAANVVDAQATYETQMALWGAVLGGANLLYHAAGWMEGGLQASFEKLVLDVEMLQHMMEFLTPIDTSAPELGLEAIERVPTGGHFFGDQHTLERYDTAFYQPMLSDWRTHEQWTDAGALTATQRATGVWQQALAEAQDPPMDDEVRAALDEYTARRREEIGDEEP